MRTRYGLAVALAVALALAGCKGKHSTTQAKPTLKSYSGWGLTIDYPGSWHAQTFRYPGKASDAMPFVWLSNQQLRQPCHRTSDGYGCDAVAVGKLEGGGVVVGWRGVLVPTSVSPAFRDGVTFGRDALPGTETITRPGWCREVRGDATVETAFYSSALRTSFLVNACLRGPDIATSEAQVQAMLASVKVTGAAPCACSSFVGKALNVTVPVVTGVTEARAKQLMEAVGLHVSTGQVGIDPAARVVGQDPAAGTTVPAGSTVTLVISSA